MTAKTLISSFLDSRRKALPADAPAIDDTGKAAGGQRTGLILPAAATVAEAARRMRDNGVSTILVEMDANLTGTVTARDIAYEIVAAGRDPEKTILSDIHATVNTTPPDDAVLRVITAAVCEIDAPLFAGLSYIEILNFLKEATILHSHPGDMIVRKGDLGTDLFVVLRGSVDIQRNINGEPRTLVTLYPGQIFGELAFLGNLPRTADVVALTTVEILVLSHDCLLRMIDVVPETAFTVLLNLSLILCEKLARSTDVQTVVLSDSERLKTQQEIDRRRTLSQMVAGVAHEINTPLGIANHAAGIIADLASDLARAPGRDDASRETLDDILAASRLMQENIARADHLVQTFKSLSVSQAVDKLESTHLLKVTQDTVDLYRLKARSSHLSVSLIDRLGENGDEWEGYPGHYAQVLLNLLTNIDLYAYPDGAGGKVEIELGAGGRAGMKDGYTVVVRDFGRGIAPGDLDHVFEPFFTTGRGKGGTGLGLPIVRNLVTESLNGEIRISSRLGVGTEVSLILPRIVATPAVARLT